MCISLSPAVTVEFEPTTYIVDERYANITVVKRGQTTQTVSVSFTTADSNAIGKYVKQQNTVLHFVTLLLVSAMLAVLKSLTLTFCHTKL